MSNKKPTNKTVESEVIGITTLDLEALRARWHHCWGDPPHYRSRELLARAFAHRLQAEASGDLPASVQRQWNFTDGCATQCWLSAHANVLRFAKVNIADPG